MKDGARTIDKPKRELKKKKLNEEKEYKFFLKTQHSVQKQGEKKDSKIQSRASFQRLNASGQFDNLFKLCAQLNILQSGHW